MINFEGIRAAVKALFTTFPAHGHLLPMLPLAQAAAAAGDDVIIAAGPELHAMVDGLTVRPLGPSLPALMAENQARSGEDVMGYRVDGADLLDTTVALFTTTRADLSLDELCELATEQRPDVIVAEMWDYVAPLVARRLDIPWVTFVHSPATSIDAVLDGGLARALEQRDLAMPDRLATVQLWPEWLEQEQNPDHHAAALPIATTPYDTVAAADIPAFDGDRPVVLVTLGTVVEDLDLLNAAVRGVLDAGADALVTTGFTAKPEQVEGDTDRMHALPFAPMAQLLDQADAVVTVGGSGTTLAALSRGLPLTFVPRIANQPLVAAVVAKFGAGLVCDDVAALPATVAQLLHQAELRDRAGAAAELLARRPAPDAVWSTLRDRVGALAR